MSGLRKQKDLPVVPHDLIARAVLRVSACTVCQSLFHHKHSLHHAVLNSRPAHCHSANIRVGGSLRCQLRPGGWAGNLLLFRLEKGEWEPRKNEQV